MSRRIRNLGCSKIDFLGSRRKHKSRDYILAKKVKEVIGKDKETEISTYCKTKNWIDARNSLNLNQNCYKIPLFDMVYNGKKYKKQFVLGRMSNLTDYYECTDGFYTLDSIDWDNLYQINDLFIYCAQSSEENIFPIRIITDIRKGIKSNDSKLGVYNYDKNLITIPHLLDQKNNIHIFSRELCQLSRYFKLKFYQSIDYPHIFFATHSTLDKLKSKIKKYNLKRVYI